MNAISSSPITGRWVCRSLLPLLLLEPDLVLQLALLVAQRGGALEVLVADRVFLLARSPSPARP